ncbi:nuclear transport factor 2 family protein [Sphingomonas profundi]|uniref:nuclear transport factor 2 family protein n=1 Tax=Alterirhizorhabdus profundi TaxID=2681549 RepID=UPI0012E91C08|nr:nuclear transport factor 2 family protein [Sphingomonas profundi]
MAFSGPLEDRVAIRELMDTYADAVSRTDAAAWAGCWAEEGALWSITFYPEIGTIEGKAKIVAAWIEAMKTFTGDNFVMTPGSIEADGDRAKVTAWTSEAYDVGETIFRDRGYYEDVCVKVDGRWFFKERVFYLRHRQTFAVKHEDRQFTH